MILTSIHLESPLEKNLTGRLLIGNKKISDINQYKFMLINTSFKTSYK